MPAVGGLIIGPIVYYFARETRGHGVPEVMEAVALRQGVNLLRGRDVNILASLKVNKVISRKSQTIRPSTNLGDILHQVSKHPYTCFYVTDKEQIYKGVVSLDDLRQVFFDGDILGNLVIAEDLMSTDIPVIYTDEPLDKVMRLFGSTNLTEFPVLESRENRRLLGVITRRTVISAYNSEVLKHDAVVSEVVADISASAGKNLVQLSNEIALVEVEAPGWMAGRTLVELDLRKRHGIQVLMINPSMEDNSPNASTMPTPDYEVKLGDNLLLVGPQEKLSELF